MISMQITVDVRADTGGDTGYGNVQVSCAASNGNRLYLQAATVSLKPENQPALKELIASAVKEAFDGAVRAASR